jgi:signal peptidase I
MTPTFQDRDLVADYRYFVVDLMSNELLAEIPFRGVSYSRSLREAGSFSGSIAVTEETINLSLYENTLPGKTAVYVTRDGICVWGGIIWTRSYNIVNKTLEVSASEFTSYLYKRIVWKTWSNAYQATIAVSSALATITLDFAQFDFTPGMPVWIDWGENRSAYAGYYTVLASPAPGLTPDDRSVFSVSATYVNRKGQTKTIPNLTVDSEATIEVRQDTYNYVRDLLRELTTDLFDFDFPNDEIRPGIDIFNEIESYSRSGNVAFLRTKESHKLVPGQKIAVTDVGGGFNDLEATVLSAPTNFTLTYANSGSDVSNTIAVENSKQVTFFQRSNSITTLTTSSAHGFQVGDIIFIDELNASIDGYHTVYSINTPTTNNFQIVNPGNKIAFSAAGNSLANATVASAVSYATWGEYTENGDIGLTYSTELPSQSLIQNELIRGFKLESVGEILEKYSNVPNGFEYRIDCSYDESTNNFKRTFVFLPIFPTSLAEYIDGLPGGSLPQGEFAPVSAYGADQIVFEYPGNVLDASLEENAQDAATRFWVQGSDEFLSSEASQPYSGAADLDLLLRGWPILEEVEKVDNVSDENTLHTYAERFLAEAKPPISNFSISVNGSLKPEVGSYNPGDWCSIIVNDDFVRLRLSSYIELNDGTGREVLLRKIDAYEVSVPDNPSFPEQVTLQLVTEAEVDKFGNQTS